MMRFSKKQRGLSSIEMVMTLPIFLLFLVLVANVGKFWHVKMDNLINARTEAWREAMFDSLSNTFCEPVETEVERLREAGELDTLFSSDTFRGATNASFSPDGRSLACQGNVNRDNAEYRGTNVLKVAASAERLNNKSKEYRTGFINEFNKTSQQPYAVTGRAYYIWAAWKSEELGVFLLEDYHVIDVNGSWQRKDLPYGHDDYITRALIND